MARAFSVACWNVEHFGALDKKKEKPNKPLKPIIEFLMQNKADILAIFEVRSRVVFRPLVKALEDYHFHITEGPQMQEILVGVRKGISTFSTQKVEFKVGQSSLRPGMLVTPCVDGKFYPLLFLHLKSLRNPKGFGLRDEMIRRVFKFRKTLEKETQPGEKLNYIIAGDLNTMGFDYIGKKHDISGDEEIKELSRRAKLSKMRVLEKSAEHTFRKGSLRGNLDHVLAADHLGFKDFNGNSVDLRGWPKLPLNEQNAWIKKYSDHALLFFEVQKI